MERFAEYLSRIECRPCAAAPLCDREVLEEVLRECEWFGTARILLAAHGVEDPRAALHSSVFGAPQPSLLPLELDGPLPAVAVEPAEAEERVSEDCAEAAEEARGVGADADVTIAGEVGDSVPDPTMEAIERFLTVGDYRIVPGGEEAEDEPVAEADSTDDGNDDMVSEELAEIYAAQGLTAQAVEIYERLSLLYPKKSVYFAEIIARIERGQTNEEQLNN